MSFNHVVVNAGRFCKVSGLFAPMWREVEVIGAFKVVKDTTVIQPVFTVTTGPEPTQAEAEYCVTSKSAACRRARILAEQTEWLAKSTEKSAKVEEKAAAKSQSVAAKAVKQGSLFGDDTAAIKVELAAVKADSVRMQAELDQLRAAVAELAAARGRKGRKQEAEAV